MKSLIHWALIILLTGLSSPAFAAPEAELNLWKHDPYLYGACGHCADFIQIKKYENYKDFMQFNLYSQSGYYSVVLYGPENTTVTLFGERNYATDKGFLIVVKKDDTAVQIENLDEFTPGKWIDVKAQKRWSGAYSVYFQPYPLFKNNVRSEKWGKWWNALSVPAPVS
jgi:hypothetical protein